MHNVAMEVLWDMRRDFNREVYREVHREVRRKVKRSSIVDTTLAALVRLVRDA